MMRVGDDKGGACMVDETTFRDEWSRIVAEDREIERRVEEKMMARRARKSEREAQITAIREVARQAGERAVELYLADLAESEWMREKSPESLT
jgi:hypothetical protein